MLYIFDMGGVVLHNVFELKTILQEEGCEEEMFDLYKDDLMYDLSAGIIREEQFWELFNARNGTNVPPSRWGKTFKPERDPGMTELIRSLRKENRVVCGTNTFEAHWKISVDRKDYDCFDKVYASHLMGVAKPSPRFWEIILEAEGFKPEETLFIDDFEENVDAAAKLGIRGILFKDLETFRADLCLSV